MVSDRYYSAAEIAGNIQTYNVKDRITGKTVATFDCMRWADRTAEELNTRTKATRRQSETQGVEKPKKERFSPELSERRPAAQCATDAVKSTKKRGVQSAGNQL